MNDQARVTLNGAQRAALRRALTSNAGWRDWSREHGVKIESASATQLLNAAEWLSIDPQLYMSAQAVAGDGYTYKDVERNLRDYDTGEVVSAAASAPSDNPANALASLIGQIAGQSMSKDAIAKLVDERLKEALRDHIPMIRLSCKGVDGETREVEGHKHPKFETLLRAATSRMADGYPPNIYIAGPAGSGKTFAGHQLAQAMASTFRMNGAIGQEHQLLGFIDAGGTYHRTQFRDTYEYGGIYMFDEVDASDNSAILALNAALANGRATFPDCMIERHKDCVIIASANTWGLGATSDYVGRARLDAAFMSRFAVRIFWDYDTALEINISGNPQFAQRVIDARARARAAGLKVLIDPRASMAGAALIANGAKSDEAAELTYLANLSPEQRKIVEGN